MLNKRDKIKRSNRTFMELKFVTEGGYTLGFGSSNRTFMELKSSYIASNCLLLLCSNRTFMELKSMEGTPALLPGSVLIAPLWN